MSNIKVKRGTAEYLDAVPQVQLNSNFQSDLNTALAKIDSNFKKMISLPFLQGDHGHSVFEQDIKIGSSNSQDAFEKELRRALIEAIYSPASTTSTSFDYNDENSFDNVFGGTIATTDGNEKSWNLDGEPVGFYRHKELRDGENEKYYYSSRQFVLFTDHRIEYLDTVNNSGQLNTFVDLSCALTVTGTAEINPSTGSIDPSSVTFTAKKYNIVPTLYYDSTKNYWCWRINGTETGVIAQGVKGDAGINSPVFICYGTKGAYEDDTNRSIITIERILQPSSSDNTNDPNTTPSIPETIPEGALILVWFNDTGSAAVTVTNTLTNCTFGIARHNSSNTAVYIEISELSQSNNVYSLDLRTIMNDVTLYRFLDDIGNPEITNYDSNPAVRGLYLPNSRHNNTDMHMMWSTGGTSSAAGLDNELYIGPVSKNLRRVCDITSANPLPSYNNDDSGSVLNGPADLGKLKILYSDLRCHGAQFRLSVPSNENLAEGMPAAAGTDYSLRSLSITDYSMDPDALNTAYPNHWKYWGAKLGKLDSNNEYRPLPNTITLRDINISGSTNEAVHLSPWGIYIRKNAGSNPNSSPAIYINHGTTGLSYIEGGRIMTSDARLYIGHKGECGEHPGCMFNVNEYNTVNDDWFRGDFNANRWKLEDSGIKLTDSHFINEGGQVIVSSDNRYRSIQVSGNRINFDYKLRAEKVQEAQPHGAINNERVHDDRPRKPEHVGIQIGGYNTIYNCITRNKTDNGTDALDDISAPIVLTPIENKEYAFLSGKSGYSAVVENWTKPDGYDVRQVDPCYKHSVNNSTGSEMSTKSDQNPYGLVTTYNCIWTKIGNVVDVKGKIFFTKAEYDRDTTSGINIHQNTSRPITYAEFFRMIKRYGDAQAFPLPIVINKSSDPDNPWYYASTGNMLDGPLVNISNPMYYETSGEIYNSPNKNSGSAPIYHNNIYNGSAQFHFYGTSEDDMGYDSAIDGFISSPSIKSQDKLVMGRPVGDQFTSQRTDMLNNVFTVTADIAKVPKMYDDRYWGFSGIPNFDSLNYKGSLTDTIETFRQRRLNAPENGPIRIVVREGSESNGLYRNDKKNMNSTSAKYAYSNVILGQMVRGGDYLGRGGFDSDLNIHLPYPAGWWERTPWTSLAQNFDHRTDFNTDGAYLPSGYDNLAKYVGYDYAQNATAYKLSLNIGAYFIRYITFSFSYLLDDDIVQSYTGGHADDYVSDADPESYFTGTAVPKSTGGVNNQTSAFKIALSDSSQASKVPSGSSVTEKITAVGEASSFKTNSGSEFTLVSEPGSEEGDGASKE